MDETLPMAFAVHRRDPPGLEVRVNFGLFAGREATAAEIDRLAEWLLDEVGEVTIVAEARHEFDSHAEAAVHQVRIEVAPDRIPRDFGERRALESRITDRAELWARLCVSERRVDVAEL